VSLTSEGTPIDFHSHADRPPVVSKGMEPELGGEDRHLELNLGRGVRVDVGSEDL